MTMPSSPFLICRARHGAAVCGILVLAACGEAESGAASTDEGGPSDSGGNEGVAVGGAPDTGGQGAGGAPSGVMNTGGRVSGIPANGGAVDVGGGTGGEVTGTTGGVAAGGSMTGGAATGGLGSGGHSVGNAGSGGAVSQASGGTSTGGRIGGGPSSGGTTGATTGGAGTGGSSTGGSATGGQPDGGSSGGSAGANTTGGRGPGTGGRSGAETGGDGGGGAGGVSTGGQSDGGAATGGSGLLDDVTVYLAGDSTVLEYQDTASTTDQAGWGQMLHEIFSDQVTVANRASGGRTALWFYLEGAAGGILDEIQPGDYFFVQFGTNDSNTTATFEVNGVTYQRYADPDTDFKTYLKDYYIEPTRQAGAIPVLVTPPPRNSAYCGTGNSLGAHSNAMRELGEAEDVTVLDLNDKTFTHLSAVCPSPSPEDFFAFKSDGSVDGTHFQENGARIMAGFLGQCIVETALGLQSYLLP